MRNAIVSGSIALILLAASALAVSPSSLAFDHLWIVVSPNAPERAALEGAGFEISPDLNKHEGQGTASITVEFPNAYLELLWPDPTVPVAPGYEPVVEKFRQRALWRTNGRCPFGIGFRRTSPVNQHLPFPTWSVTPDWLPAGSSIEILQPRNDTRSPSLFISPDALTNMEDQAKLAARFHHPIGVHLVTAIRLIFPRTYQPIEPLTFLQKSRLLDIAPGDAWLVEMTFDAGKLRNSKDLRPDLPLVIRY